MKSNQLKYKPTSLLVLLFICINCAAQTGSFTATFVMLKPVMKPITVTFSQPIYKSDNTNGYWFTNPHNGARHLTILPEQGFGNKDVAFISIGDRNDDMDIYSSGSDSNSFACQNAKYLISAPTWSVQKGDDNKPLHIHITSFTNTEVAFIISGTAALNFISGDNGTPGFGTITGSGHFYREGGFIKSDLLKGCNCDPTIYPNVYDAENNIRTTSACENAMINKVFGAVQKSLLPLFSVPSNMQTLILPGHANINVPAREDPYCTIDYNHQHLTTLHAEKNIFTSEDAYGIRIIKIPGNDEMSISNNDAAKDAQKQMMLQMQELIKKSVAKQITTEEYNKEMASINAKANAVNKMTGTDDMGKKEIDYNLYLTVIINGSTNEIGSMYLSDKANTVVQHNVSGASFEIFSPMIKATDGTWLKNKFYIYFGKFTAPVSEVSVGGYDAKLTSPIYPPNAPKLAVYNVIIKMEGSKEIIDMAKSKIDFSALTDLINH
jgi:hypothetical protein